MNTGRIVEISGPVIDCRFEAGHLPKIKEAINKCPGVIEEIAVNVKEMIGIVTTKGYIQGIIENAKKRFPEILININSAVMMFRDGYFKQCGRNAGLALAILLKID